MKQFMTVLRFELNNYLKNKSFMVTTILLAVLMAAIIVVPAVFLPGIINNVSEENNNIVGSTGPTDEDGTDALGLFQKTDEKIDISAFTQLMPSKWTEYGTEESLKEAVEKEEVKAGFILDSVSGFTYVVNNLSMTETLSSRFQNALVQYQKQSYLAEKGLSMEEISQLDTFSVTMDSQVLGKNSVRNYGYTYALVFIIYFLILFYGQMIAVSVTTEKSNRAIEILVTSVNPNSLIFGKVLAGAIAGILQMVVIVGAGAVSYKFTREAWNGFLDFLFDIPVNIIAAYIVFGILSYLLYAFIFGMLGALVSKTEDISKSATPVTIVYVASFLIAMMGLGNSDSLLMKVASFIPFTSGNAMFIRVSMGEVAVWEVFASAVLLLGTCIGFGILAAKLFRFGTLHYGNPIKISKALKSIRQQ